MRTKKKALWKLASKSFPISITTPPQQGHAGLMGMNHSQYTSNKQESLYVIYISILWSFRNFHHKFQIFSSQYFVFHWTFHVGKNMEKPITSMMKIKMRMEMETSYTVSVSFYFFGFCLMVYSFLFFSFALFGNDYHLLAYRFSLKGKRYDFLAGRQKNFGFIGGWRSWRWFHVWVKVQ